MINFIQLNQNITQWEENIITDEIWERIYTILELANNSNIRGQTLPINQLKDNHHTEDCPILNVHRYKYLIQYIHDISIQYNTDKKNILKYYYQYIIRNKKHIVTSKYLKKVESIMHFRGTNIEHILLYFSTPLKN
jgi:hypothetical protein